MILHYHEVRNQFVYPSLREWFTDLFADDPQGVVAVMLNDPFPGALHWIIANREKAKTVREKFKNRHRVWTLHEVQEYVECFGEKAETVKVAALLFSRGEGELNASMA